MPVVCNERMHYFPDEQGHGSRHAIQSRKNEERREHTMRKETMAKARHEDDLLFRRSPTITRL